MMVGVAFSITSITVVRSVYKGVEMNCALVTPHSSIPIPPHLHNYSHLYLQCLV